MNSKTGVLYIVATPIGNLGDMSARAIDILRSVDLVLAEDTRQTGILFQHFGIQRPMASCHEHNEKKQLPTLLGKLQSGQSIALVSDAGTPLISDPGFLLVRELREQGIAVIPIPGACAVIAALSASGLPTDRFCFEGFPPAKTTARKTFYRERLGETRTMVMYESSHRILASLEDLADVMGSQRQIVVARELSKKFEQFYSGSCESVIAEIGAEERHRKGEFVVLVAGAEAVGADDQEIDRLLTLLLPEMALGTASKIAARWLGINRKRVYERGLVLDKKGESD